MHFYVAFEKQWKRENKSFGFEIQTIRIGGLDRRLADTARILKQYANGELACIEELEETYQPFCYFEKIISKNLTIIYGQILFHHP